MFSRVFILLAVLVTAACSPENNGTGSIAPEITFVSKGTSSSLTASQKTSGNLRSKTVNFGGTLPADLNTVRVTVTSGATVLGTQDFAASARTGTLTGIPTGSNRTLTVLGLDSGNVTRYRAVQNNITVSTGVNPVAVVAVGTSPIVDGFARYVDSNSSSTIDFGDQIIVSFDQDVALASGASISDFTLPVTGDSFGSGAAVTQGLAGNEVIITLGVSPSLIVQQVYTGATSSGSPSGIDVSSVVASISATTVNNTLAAESTPVDIVGSFAANYAAASSVDTVTNSTRDIALADLNNDGLSDMFVVNAGQANRVLTGNSNGTFSDSGQSLGGFDLSESVVLGDVDGDGDLDAVVGNTDYDSVNTSGVENKLFLNTGGGFTEVITFLVDSTGAFTSSARDTNEVALADLDGDGDLDYLEVNGSGWYSTPYFNDGSGEFMEKTDSSASFTGIERFDENTDDNRAVALGDVDGNGTIDAVFGNGSGDAGSVYLNDGTGAFDFHNLSLGIWTTEDIALGDLDGDGDLDVILANSTDLNAVYLNDGTGSFSFNQNFDSSSSYGVSLNDVDGDGDLDAVFANGGTSANTVYLNNGGTFTLDQNLGSSNSISVAVADLQSDGDLDFVFANDGSVNTIHLNQQPNFPPIANAGADQIVASNSSVTLADGGSTDSDGTITSYSWTQLSGVAVTLTGAATTSPTFTAPSVSVDEVLTFQLTVTDDNSDTAFDTVDVTVQPEFPAGGSVPSGWIQPSTTPTAGRTVAGGWSVASDQTFDGSFSLKSDVITHNESANISVTDNFNAGTISFRYLVDSEDSGTTPPNYDYFIFYIDGDEQIRVDGTGAGWQSFSTTLSAGTHTLMWEYSKDGSQDTGQDAAWIDAVVLPATSSANNPPTANAGSNLAVASGASVNLSDAGSSDTDGAIVSYVWTQLSGTSVSLTNAATASASFTAPTVGANEILSFQLTVTDNNGASATDTVDITVLAAPNNAPTANAGADQSVISGVTVALDGSGSSDSDGSIASYSWVQVAGAGVGIAGSSSSAPTFTAPTVFTAETYSFQLTVTDDDGATNADTVDVTINPANNPPVADAGFDTMVGSNVAVVLTGSGSDTDGTIASYSWQQISGPSTLSLTGASTESVSFTSPTVSTNETYTFQLTVTDDDGATSTDTAIVTVTTSSNTAPTANAGVDQVVVAGNLVTIAGFATDSDGSISSYSWSQISGPAATLSFGTTAATLNFNAPSVSADTDLVFRLTVIDDLGSIDTADVTITVTNTANISPIADAGADTTAVAGDTVGLSAGGSSDSDGSIITYLWDQIDGPAVTLVNLTSSTAHFTAPAVTADTIITFRLTVEDNGNAIDTDDIVVTVLAPPRRVSGSARYYDTNKSSSVDSGDQLVIPFDGDVDATGATVADFNLPVFSDTLGAGATFSNGPASNEVTVTLGTNPVLSARSEFTGANAAGSPSGVDVSSSNTSGISGGFPTTPIDIIPGFVDAGASIGSSDTESIALGDIDDDGDIDMITANANNQANGVWKGDGTGAFVLSQTLGTSDSKAVKLADFDGDGDLDVIFGNSINQANNIYLNNGAGSFSTVQYALGNSNTQGLAIGDVDGDGDLDVVESSYNGSSSKVYLNDINGTNNFIAQTAFSTGDGYAVELADIDSDGDLDLIEANAGTNANRIYTNNGSGVFTFANQFLGTNASVGLAVGDVDRDGDLDLVFANGNGGNTVYTNDGSGTYTDSGQSLGSDDTREVALNDIDSDGDLDIIATNNASHNQIFYNDGKGIFTDSSLVIGDAADVTYALAIGDIDGDLDTDIVTGNINSSGSAANKVYLNSLTGSWGDSTLVHDIVQTSLFNFDSVNSLVDVDGDGDLDIVRQSGLSTSQLSVQLNNGDGVFSNVQPSGGNTLAYSFATGDIDKDGDIDVIRGGSNGTANTILLNDGTGVFSDSGQSLGNYQTQDIVLGDIDGDGDLDLVEADSSGVDRIYTNTGGSFTETGTLNGATSFGLALGDIDNDGDLDIASTDGKIFTNNGSGSFSDSGQALNVYNARSAIGFYDLDGDSDLDLIIGTSIYMNNGFGTFIINTVQSLSAIQGRPHFADMNGDGNVDIIYVSSNRIRIGYTDGLGNISFSTNFGSSTTSQRSLAVGDIDSDGDLDVLQAFEISSTQSFVNFNGAAQHISPQVNASVAQTVESVDFVTLYGSANDFDGSIGTYTWTQLSGPSVSLSGSTTATASFTAPTVTTDDYLTFALTATDNDSNSTTQYVTIKVAASVSNAIPSAFAGVNQTVQTGNDVTLAGSGLDSDGSIVAYKWVQTSGTAVHITDSDKATASFTLPTVSSSALLTFRLFVTDDEGGVATDEVTITNSTASNIAPTANAGADQTVNSGSGTVNLSDGGSFDSDGFIFAFKWTQISGNPVTLSNDTSSTASFIAPTVASTETLTFRLTATDNGGATNTDEVIVTISSGPPVVSGKARFYDVNDNGMVDSGDELVIPFDQAVSVSSATSSDLSLPVTGDSFGAGAAVTAGPASNEVTVTLGTSPSLKARQDFTGVSTSNSPSGVDVSGSNSGIINAVSSTAIDIIAGIKDTGVALGTDYGRGIELADIDDDGDLDMILANGNGSDSTIYVNDGSGGYSLSQTIPGALSTGTNNESVAVGDIDRDGDLDIVFSSQSNSGTQIYTNTSGTFAKTATLGSGANENGMQVKLGDIDNDGDLDIVLAQFGGQVNRVYFNGGSGTYSESAETLGTNDSRGVALGDLNADGYLDIVFANATGEGNQVYLNDGDGTFTDSAQSLGTNDSEAVILGDIDLDGDLDVVFANSGTTNSNTVYLNDGAGNFGTATQSLGTVNSYDVKLFDYDSDGDLDLLSSSFNGGNGDELYSNDGLGNFTLAINVGFTSTFENALGDIDGDGDIDIVRAQYNTAGAKVYKNSISAVWGSTTITDSGQFLGSGASYDVKLVDIDKDGDLDKVVANYSSQGNTVWENDGIGNFTLIQSLGNSNSWVVETGDLDNDGDQDLVFGNVNAGNTVWLNTGSGATRFTTNGQSLGSSSSYGIALGDIDRDGDLDLVVANYTDANTVWENNGTGVFTLIQTSSILNALSVKLADMNNDGILDYVYGRYSNLQNQVFIGNGVLTQSTFVNYPFGAFINTWEIDVVDFDNDGYLDIVSSNQGTSAANEVHLNPGSSNPARFDLVTPSTFAANNSRKGAVADIDGDGDFDLIVSVSGGLNELYSNDGTGIINFMANFGATSNTDSVDVGDIDGDGDIDIVEAVNGAANAVYTND